jgi:hypothetical protein
MQRGSASGAWLVAALIPLIVSCGNERPSPTPSPVVAIDPVKISSTIDTIMSQYPNVRKPRLGAAAEGAGLGIGPGLPPGQPVQANDYNVWLASVGASIQSNSLSAASAGGADSASALAHEIVAGSGCCHICAPPACRDTDLMKRDVQQMATVTQADLGELNGMAGALMVTFHDQSPAIRQAAVTYLVTNYSVQ